VDEALYERLGLAGLAEEFLNRLRLETPGERRDLIVDDSSEVTEEMSGRGVS
jgi:hypothetical protein